MSIEATEFRRVLGHFATGVTVITTRHQNQLHGTTVSSFCSLSLDPPLILVCLDRQATIHDLILASGSFGVNILAEHGEKTSRHFARRTPDKFSEITYGLGQLDVPLLKDALATLECRVMERYPGGDHSIFVGKVIAINAQADARAHPLLFFRSKYDRLQSDASTTATSVPTISARVDHASNVPALANGAALD